MEEPENKKLIVQKEKINIKIENKLVLIATILIFFVLIFLFVEAFIYSSYFNNENLSDYNESLSYKTDNIFLNIIGVVIGISLIKIISKLTNRINKKILLVLCFVIITIIGVFWLNFAKPIVRADQKMVLDAAVCFYEKRFEILGEKLYLYSHPLQLGCVLGLELIVRILDSSNPIYFQYINLGILLVCVVLIYKISEKIYQNEDNQRVLIILSSMMIVIPLYSVIVYGNIYGLVFSLFAIFFLLKYYETRKVRYIILLPVFLSFAIIYKSNYEIMAVAIIISLILDLIKKFNFKSCVLIALTIAVILGSYPLIYKIVEIRTGVKPNDGIPMITYVAMSIQEGVLRNSGWYHDTKNVETIYSDNNFDSELTKKESMEIINSRIKEFKGNPKMAKNFYMDKIKSTWLEPAFQTFWWSEPLEGFFTQPEEYRNYVTSNKILLSILHGKAHTIIIYYMDIMEILVFGLSSISVLYWIKNKEYSNEKFILVLCFLGGFLFHIIWETKCIYVIPFYLMLLPSAADGVGKLNCELKKVLSFKKK